MEVVECVRVVCLNLYVQFQVEVREGFFYINQFIFLYVGIWYFYLYDYLEIVLIILVY